MDDNLLRVLVIEDNENDFILLQRALQRDSISAETKRVDTVELIDEAFRQHRWDIVISDNNIPDKRISVQSSLRHARAIDPNIPFIIVSGTIGEENAVSLMKLGVQDYILKDNLARLGPAIKRELAEAVNRSKKDEAEKNLLDSQERYRMLAESITDMFFALDKDLNCTFWNKAAEKMTGINEAVGRNLFELLPQTRQEPLRSKLIESFKSSTSSTFDLQYKKNNLYYYHQVTIYPSAEMHSVMVKDVTESKTTSRKLKNVNNELETFIYRLSHDIRGPLASVQGLINLARTEKLALVESDFYSRLHIMANRMDDVISSFQDVVKIKQEKVNPQETSIAAVIETARKKLGCTSQDYLLELDPSAADGLLVTDADFLVIAVENMIANSIAYRHLQRKPELVIIFRRVEGEYNELIIRDNGIGIPSEIHDKIFNMFYRGNTGSSGPGLGLYLALNAVEKLGGTIRVKSSELGTSFAVRLPLTLSPAEKEDAAPFQIEL